MKSKTLPELRREVEKQHCPKCGEPLDLLPCCRYHETRKDEMLAALEGMFKAADEIAIEFIENKRAADWGVINRAYMAAEKVVRESKAAPSQSTERQKAQGEEKP